MFVRAMLAIVLLAAPIAAFAGPKIQHWTLGNGARAYFVPAQDLPMLQIRVAFDAGSSRDPSGREGLARLTAAMLNEGAGELSADDIALQLESLGAELGAGVDRDMATVNLRSLSDSELLTPALDLFAKILTAPSFPAASLERHRAQTLVALQKDSQSPGAVAEKTFYRELYGNHPYAHSTSGDEGSIKTITRDDLLQFHRKYFVGANAWIVIVGDASKRQARKIADRIVGKLPAGEPVSALPAVTSLYAAKAKRIDFHATQSHVIMGQPGLRRGDPDYFPLYVGNYILGGGGLISRLSVEVREKKGFSYSIYSYFYPLRKAGPMVVGFQTKNTQRDEALKLVNKVISDFVSQGPTQEELEAAKKHITGSFPLRLDSNGKIAENLSVISFYGLPLTYLDEFIPNVESVTVEQIRQAFRQRVRPDNLLTVTVGGSR